jgi:hypothetical protein
LQKEFPNFDKQVSNNIEKFNQCELNICVTKT